MDFLSIFLIPFATLRHFSELAVQWSLFISVASRNPSRFYSNSFLVTITHTHKYLYADIRTHHCIAKWNLHFYTKKNKLNHSNTISLVVLVYIVWMALIDLMQLCKFQMIWLKSVKNFHFHTFGLYFCWKCIFISDSVGM